MIELSGVHKSYGETKALDGLDLHVQPGRTTVLIGPSGCGKSTILRLVVGLVRPDAGSVRFDGEPVEPGNVQGLRRRMGYVIQEGGLLPHLDARRNASLMARYLGWSRTAIDRRLDALAELARLPPEALDRLPDELSGGQRQRISLMRALMLDPELLLLDEPLGALDPLIRAELQRELREIFARLHRTVLLVTHDLAEAAWFADEIVLMRAGRVVQQGTLDDLWHRPADPFVSRFIRAQRQPLTALSEPET